MARCYGIWNRVASPAVARGVTNGAAARLHGGGWVWPMDRQTVLHTMTEGRTRVNARGADETIQRGRVRLSWRK